MLEQGHRFNGLFFFEVETWPELDRTSRSGIKMVHEMQLGEMGSMIVSTPVLARYKVGDLIRAFEPPYYCGIGHDKWYAPLRHAWDEFGTFDLGWLELEGSLCGTQFKTR